MGKIEKVIQGIGELNHTLMKETQERLDNLTKPQGSLGRLEEMAKLIVGITEKKNPSLQNKVIFTLAGDHGVADEGVSAYPKEVTLQMVYNFLAGGAGINVLARYVGARVVVVDMGVASKIQKSPIEMNSSQAEEIEVQNLKSKKINLGTKNMTKCPAMTREEAIKSIETGIDTFEEELPNGIDIIGTGDMGIGNTTASSAMVSVITANSVEEVTGRGTGIDDKTFAKKVAVIKTAIETNKPDTKDVIDVLSKLGGFEIGGLAGIILASASKRIPVIIDGFISGAAALVAYRLQPAVKNYIVAAHCSVERGHKIILDRKSVV